LLLKKYDKSKIKNINFLIEYKINFLHYFIIKISNDKIFQISQY